MERLCAANIHRQAMTQAKKTAGYHRKRPSTMPIIPAYHTSASPNFFLEQRYASKKTQSPSAHPIADNASTERPYAVYFSKNNTAAITHIRFLETDPVFISATEIKTEKSKNVA